MKIGQDRRVPPAESVIPPHRSPPKPKTPRSFWLDHYMKHPWLLEGPDWNLFEGSNESRRYARWLFEKANPGGLVT